MKVEKALRFGLVIMLALGAWFACQANAGLPMFVVQFPFALFAALPVIGLETVVLKRLLRTNWRMSIWESTKANFFSTMIGYPLSWGIAFVIELLATGGSCGPGFDTLRDSLITTVVEAAWMCPYEPFPRFAVPGALLVLLTIAWVISVFVEFKVLLDDTGGVNSCSVDDYSVREESIRELTRRVVSQRSFKPVHSDTTIEGFVAIFSFAPVIPEE